MFTNGGLNYVSEWSLSIKDISTKCSIIDNSYVSLPSCATIRLPCRKEYHVEWTVFQLEKQCLLIFRLVLQFITYAM